MQCSVTEKNFLFVLEILIIADCPYTVSLRGTCTVLATTDEPLQPGHYDIKPNSGGEFITDEPCITRVLSTFRKEVRERDGRCVITGVINPDADVGRWRIFETAHIFPFRQGLFSVDYRQRGSIYGDQLIMRSHIHQLFDGFDFSINPDDNYKIPNFDADLERLDGRELDPICRDPNDERSVRDEFLRWHFRQAILTNMRGAGEPVFEFDFPPVDQRMEAELFSRLNDASLAQ
ncbi:hypothetical protein V1515DRAFT_616797 [Lipomyces mesembrius]